MRISFTAVLVSFGLVLSLSTYGFACGGNKAGGGHQQQGQAIGQGGCGGGSHSQGQAATGGSCSNEAASGCGGGAGHSHGQDATSQGGSCSNEGAQPAPSAPVSWAPGDNPLTLVQSRCGQCHNPNVVFMSRKAEWSNTVRRMEKHIELRKVHNITPEEENAIIEYLNSNNGVDAQATHKH